MALAGARKLMAALWAGSLWTVGYLAAPTLFAHVEANLAGQMVGHLLTSEAWLSIGCAAVLLVLLRFAADVEAPRKRLLNILAIAMLACALVLYFGIQPFMAHLRELAGPGGVRNSPQWTQFAVLHGVSQLVYVIESLLGALLVVKAR